jgi:hypothetical protein
MQAHEGIEDEQLGLELLNGFAKPRLIADEIETQRRRGDHLDVELGEIDAGDCADSVEPPAYNAGRVLRRIEEDASSLLHRKFPEARATGGHGDCHVEREK